MGLAPARAAPAAAGAAPSPDPLDIAGAADRAAALLKGGQVGQGVQLVEDARRNRSQVVQDALDRSVAARARACFVAPAGAGQDVRDALMRIERAGAAYPRMPVAAQVAVLNQQQQHDVYASIVETRGSAEAAAALTRGERVILGLRSEGSTFVNRGQGNGYADRIVVVWRMGTQRRVELFNASNTQPTAQYDANQRRNPDIVFRRADGEDVTGDGVPELGRLREGSYALFASTHRNPASAGTNFALRPTDATVAAGAGEVERDSNHDGLFDAGDAPNRFSDLNSSFLIHSGSRTNTDSAGCQTIAPADFRRFQQVVEAGTQRTWQYVLTRVAP